MKKTILAKIQLVHSYVTNFSISINDKIENEHQVELEGQVEFKILDITCIEDKCCAVIELGNSIELKNIGKTIGNIDITMRGFFEGYNCNPQHKYVHPGLCPVLEYNYHHHHTSHNNYHQESAYQFRR